MSTFTLRTLLPIVLVGMMAFMPTVHARFTHALPFITSGSNLTQVGLIRIINVSDRSGSIRIYATDDAGQRFGPVDLDLPARQAIQFTSQHLERGNPEKGLSGGVGDGKGNWWILIDTDPHQERIPIRAIANLRTPDGFLTEMHSVVPRNDHDGGYSVVFFNPASNLSLASRLRIVNPHSEPVDVTIQATDDLGDRGEEPVRLTLDAQESVMLTSVELESGGSGFSGRFGDGRGKWQLAVSATRRIWLMNLLATRSGHITNLSLPKPVLAIPRQPEDAIANTVVPSSFTVNCGINICMLWWSNPHLRYDHHALTRIYRSQSCDFSTAREIGVDTGISYVDRTAVGGESYCYWIRWENTNGDMGPARRNDGFVVENLDDV